MCMLKTKVGLGVGSIMVKKKKKTMSFKLIITHSFKDLILCKLFIFSIHYPY